MFLSMPDLTKTIHYSSIIAALCIVSLFSQSTVFANPVNGKTVAAKSGSIASTPKSNATSTKTQVVKGIVPKTTPTKPVTSKTAATKTSKTATTKSTTSKGTASKTVATKSPVPKSKVLSVPQTQLPISKTGVAVTKTTGNVPKGSSANLDRLKQFVPTSEKMVVAHSSFDSKRSFEYKVKIEAPVILSVYGIAPSAFETVQIVDPFGKMVLDEATMVEDQPVKILANGLGEWKVTFVATNSAAASNDELATLATVQPIEVNMNVPVHFNQKAWVWDQAVPQGYELIAIINNKKQVFTNEDGNVRFEWIEGANTLSLQYQFDGFTSPKKEFIVMVDTVRPGLQILAPSEALSLTELETISLKVEIENFHKLFVNEIPQKVFLKPGATKAIVNVPVELEFGVNDIRVKVVDLAGNVTEQSISVERVEL